MEEKSPMGLYIHIPFCNRKCDYCDFVSYSMGSKAQQEYLAGLFAEIDMLKDKFEDRIFDTIFIGGGTPSIMFEGFFSSLTRKLYSSFRFTDKIEFTMEINPSSFTREKFLEYAEAGVNRISVGVQCLDEKILAMHGRIQTVDNIKNTFDILTSSQFKNVNGDIMIGIPGQTAEMVEDTVKFLIKHKVKHISTYGLQIEKHTMLYDKLKSGQIRPMKDDDIAFIYEKVNKVLKKHGYVRYELSNYARPGFECRHNIKYWNESEFLGLGVSAYSFVDGYRYYNTKRLDTYIDAMQQGKSAVYKKAFVSFDERRTERIMLSLRTNKGLDLNKFKQDFNEDLLKSHSVEILRLEDKGMITVKNNWLRVTDKYFYVSNSIILELM